MKRWLTTSLVFWAVMVHAQHVTLAWDPSPSPGVNNYRIYFGTNSGSYSFVTNTGLVLTQKVVLPYVARWFFAATAMDTNGLESDFSNEVVWEGKIAPPVLRSEAWFRLAPEFWRSTNQVDWVSFKGEATWLSATNQQEFFTMRGLLIERMQRVNEP